MQKFMKSFTSPRALVFMVLALVATMAQAAGVDVLAFLQAHPSSGLLAFAGEVDGAKIEAALVKITDQVREAGEKALAEARTLTNGQKERIDELLLKQGELQGQVTELEQKAARRAGADAVAQAYKSVGYRTIEDANFKAATEKLGQRRQGLGSIRDQGAHHRQLGRQHRC